MDHPEAIEATIGEVLDEYMRETRGDPNADEGEIIDLNKKEEDL